ncbi:MAG: translocation/assembly module TamB domain-containing protein [Sideroxyarcus sp.]|nr:translocation/assembly module TamB domain-containing protein [Sideroxyarcus sp.]
MAIRMPRLRVYLLVLLAGATLLAGGATWLLTSNGGLRWVSEVVQARSGGRLEISGVEGALIDEFGIERLLLHGDGWRVEMAEVRMHWQPAKLFQGELNILSLSARQVDVLALPGDAPFVMPDTLRLPLKIDVLQMQIGTLRLFSHEQGAPDSIAHALCAHFRADQNTHQLQDLQARFAAGEVSGDARIAQDAPYPLQANLVLHGALPLAGKTAEVNALAELSGDLRQLELNLAGTAAGAQLNAALQLLPAAASPLAHARIGFSDVDVHWLAQDAPTTALSGEIDLKGTAPGVLEGTAQLSNARAATLDHGGLPLTAARARWHLSQSKLQLHKLELHLLHGGLLQGEAGWQMQQRQGSAHLQVRALDPAALDSRAPALNLQGAVTLDAGATKQKAQVSLHDEMWQLEGELLKHGTQIDLSQLRLTRGNAVLTGGGQLKLDAQYQFRLDTRLQHLNLAEFSSAPSTELNAGLAISGELLPEPSGLLDFVFFDSRIGGHTFEGDGRLRVLPGPRASGDLSARLGDNTLNMSLAYGTKEDYLRLSLDAPQLAQVGNGLAGQLTGQMEWRGSLDEPVASFSFKGEQLELPSGISIEELVAGGALGAQMIELSLTASAVRGGGALALPQVQLDLNGSAAQHTLHAQASLTRNEQALGDISLAASGGWARTGQAWRWQGALDALTTHGVLPMQLQAAAPLVVAPDEVTLGAAQLAIAGGRVDLHETRWSAQGWHSAGSFGGIGVRAIEASVAPIGAGAQALDTLCFGGGWDVSAAPEWRGNIDLHRESGDWVVNASSGERLGLREVSVGLQAAADMLELQLNASGERLGEFSAEARMPFRTQDGMPVIAPDAPLRGQLKLHSADLGWLGPMLDGNLQSGGSLHLEAELLGTRDMPRLLGEARGEGLHVALLDQGVSLEQGELVLRFTPDAVHIDRLDFIAPYHALPKDLLLGEYRLPRKAGHLSASGSILLTDETGQLDVVAEGLPLAQRPDRWLIVSGKAEAAYASKTLSVSGNIGADAGLVNQLPTDRPRLAEDVRLVGQTPAKKSAFSRVVVFNLDLGEHFYLRAMGLESRLSGKLAVYAAADEAIQASGSIATEQGILNVYGQRLDVERGMFNFQGPPDDPGLNILALRKGLSVEAGVEVSGTARHPVIRLVSTPNVPDAEKLSWIILGRVPESGGFDTSLLLAAGNAIGSSSNGQVGRAIGVDELSLQQKESGDSQSQVVIVGKRLSSRAYLSYEQGLTAPGGVTKFTYTLTSRITLVTRTGIEDAIDLFYSFRFY